MEALAVILFLFAATATGWAIRLSLQKTELEERYRYFKNRDFFVERTYRYGDIVYFMGEVLVPRRELYWDPSPPEEVMKRRELELAKLLAGELLQEGVIEFSTEEELSHVRLRGRLTAVEYGAEVSGMTRSHATHYVPS